MRRPPRVMPALVTPFTRRGDVDLEAHRHNLLALRDRGMQGFLLGGSTGEGPYLEPGERYHLVDTARSALGRRSFLLAGVAAETLRVALGQVAEAEEAGADAVLVLTPTSLARERHDDVAAYYQELAEESRLPLLLYSVPGYTAYELPLDVASRLFQHPDVRGMKDSGGHPVRLTRLAEAAGDGYVFAGASAAVALSVAGGAYGAITASANYAPELVREVVLSARRSAAAAGAPQARLLRLASEVEAHRIPGVKAAAAHTGLRPGQPRAPLRPLTGASARAVRRAVEGLP